ncbi:uncharacterized protein LOC130624958 [Hydractinia symbiolongicarpus]|uniref:uncharacterized protein LOC130624958 n=1 Tax=Hydractinia symbiolongicarpus TaxID=13093 RepID=UPI002550D3C8|nr:uncharacterized protein LOC130624958 [Hydractinia symbiolongicarpus]
MAFKVLTLILLLVAIKYILTEGNLYLIHNVNDIKKGKIIKHSKGFTRTTCLLKCRNNQDCDTAYFKANQGNNAIGECWFVQEGGEDELELPNKSDGGKVESFENVPYYETKKKNTSSNADDWKLQATNVCFGVKGDSYGNFTLKHTGTIKKLKLEHTGEEGTLNCRSNVSNVTSRWGCHYFGEERISTVITDKNNRVLIPNFEFLKIRFVQSYYLPGYHGNSPYLQFDNLNISARYGDELRIWHLVDLRDFNEEELSKGKSCADVYAVFHN